MNEFIKNLISSNTIEVLEEQLNKTLPDDEAGQSEFHSRRKTYEHNMRSDVYTHNFCTIELRNCIVNIHFLIGDDDKTLTNTYFDCVYTPNAPLERINITIAKR